MDVAEKIHAAENELEEFVLSWMKKHDLSLREATMLVARQVALVADLYGPQDA